MSDDKPPPELADIPGRAVLPGFLRSLPSINVGLAGVHAYALRGAALCVIFEFSEDTHVPKHAHGAQFGYVVTGHVQVRRGGRTHTLKCGDAYLIEAEELHEAWISKGTTLIEFFEDADRY